MLHTFTDLKVHITHTLTLMFLKCSHPLAPAFCHTHRSATGYRQQSLQAQMASATRLGTSTASTVYTHDRVSTSTGESTTVALEASPFSTVPLMLCVDTPLVLAVPGTVMGLPNSVGRVAPLVSVGVASVLVCTHGRRSAWGSRPAWGTG